MSVRTRKTSIEELEMTILESKNGHATKLSTISPTSGKVYTIELTPFIDQVGYGFYTTCKDNAGCKCYGNTYTVCKHSLAAVLHRIKAQGKMLYKCNSLSDAVKLNNILKGTLITITSEFGIAYGIVDTKVEVKTPRTACGRLESNVKLMRDTEKFID